ncbi:MAG: recombinase RecA, partial [Synechococcus elongatus]
THLEEHPDFRATVEQQVREKLALGAQVSANTVGAAPAKTAEDTDS